MTDAGGSTTSLGRVDGGRTSIIDFTTTVTIPDGSIPGGVTIHAVEYSKGYECHHGFCGFVKHRQASAHKPFTITA